MMINDTYNALKSGPRFSIPIPNSAKNSDTNRLAIKNQLIEPDSQPLFPATYIKN